LLWKHNDFGTCEGLGRATSAERVGREAPVDEPGLSIREAEDGLRNDRKRPVITVFTGARG